MIGKSSRLTGRFAALRALALSALLLALGATGLALAPARAAAAESTADDYASYVDPFAWTAVDNGQQFPGAVYPYGIVKMSADTYPHTNDDHAGYDYNATKISGFSHTRIEGVGGQGAGGDVLITPTYVTYTAKPSLASRAQSFSHDDESATPGYYSVGLTPNTGTDDNVKADGSDGLIECEQTATTRTGFQRYTFPKAGQASIVLDLNYTYHGTDIRNAVMNVGSTADGKTSISGRFSAHNVSGHGTYTLYFYTVVDTPVESVKTWNGDSFGDSASLTGNDLGAVLTLNVAAGQKVQVKTAISPISAEQAQADMAVEDSGWDFDAVKQAAHDQWNAMLSKAQVESSATSDPDGSYEKLFYTSLYRMFMTPVNATSTSGTYRGTDGKVYTADGYTHYDSWTMWDDFRKYPILSLIEPDVYKDIVQSVADEFVTGISTWGNDTQSVLTVRNEHTVAVLADGVSKGYTDIKNLDRAYEAAKAFVKSSYSSDADSLGYVSGRVDQTVERSYDYWALSVVAKALGKTDEASDFASKGEDYLNIYKADAASTVDGGTTGLLWPKDSSGNWQSADPERYGEGGLYQGTIWQYTWWDTYDTAGLMNAMGGKDSMLSALETLYGAKDEGDDGSRMLHSNTNEIDLQTPYLFNVAGKPSLTQYWVRKIYTGETWNRYSGTGEYNPPQYAQVYRLAPDGLMETMDDDAGTMATMYATAAMGLFPLSTGDSAFQIGSPFFEQMTLDVGGGKTFTIKADGVSPSSYYIQDAKLNGSDLTRTWLDYDEVARGGELDLTMGEKASTWGEDGKQAPSASDKTATSAFKHQLSYSTNAISVKNGEVDATVTAQLDKDAAFSDDVAANGSVTFGGLPDGVTATVERTGSRAITIHLTGTIKAPTSETQAFAVTADFSDAAFADGVKSAQVGNGAGTGMGAIKITDTEEPTSLTVTAPAKTSYLTGEALDLAGGSVTVGYRAAGLTKTLALTDELVKVGSLPSKAGAGQKVEVSYGDVKGSFTVDVSDPAANDAGQVAYYTFSGAQNGTVADESGNGYTATLVNGASVSDGSLVLDGTKNQYLNVAAGALGGLSGDATISAWLRVTSTANNQVLLCAGRDTDNYLLLSPVSTLRGSLNVGGSGEQSASYAKGAGESVWVNVTYVLKGSKATMYLNGRAVGVADAKGSLADIMGSGASVHVGGGDFWDDPTLTGRVSSLAVYDRALSAKEVASEMLRTDNRLAELVGQADALLDSGTMSSATAEKLQEARDGAAAVDSYGSSTQKQRDQVCDDLTAAIDKAEAEGAPVRMSAYDALQAEGYGTWSGGNLKAETSTESSGSSVGDVGGTYDGGWLGYEGVDFGSDGARSVSVRYAGNNQHCGRNARVEVHLDSMDGDPVATVSLPSTASSDWGTYALVSAKLDKKVTGVHDVYFVMRNDGGGLGYVANFDYFAFGQGDSAGVGKFEAESKNDWSGGALKTEGSTDAAGASLTDVGGTYDGAWLKFSGLEFGDAGSDTFTVRYVNNSSRCGANCRLELRLDSSDGQKVGEISLPATGDNWNAYATATAKLDQPITGTHDLYAVMRTDGGNAGYVGNFDWFQFGSSSEPVGKLEAESKTDWGWASGKGALKTEGSTDASGAALTNVANTFDGSWLEFAGVSFGDAGRDTFTVRYSNMASVCGSNCRLELYLDSKDGDPVATVSLPPTGTAWSAYGTMTAELPQTITGTHDLYVVMRSDHANDKDYVGNFDWFQFSLDGSRDTLNAAIAAAQKVVDAGTGSYAASDVERLTEALAAAKALAADGSASRADMRAAANTLNVAVGRLRKAADKSGLEAGIQNATERVDTSHWDDDSLAAFNTALAYAQSVNADDAATQQAVDLATSALAEAIENGKDKAEVDKTRLEAQISQGRAVGPTGFDAKKYQKLEKAVKAAEKVDADKNATAQEAADAAQAVQAAREALHE